MQYLVDSGGDGVPLEGRSVVVAYHLDGHGGVVAPARRLPAVNGRDQILQPISDAR